MKKINFVTLFIISLFLISSLSFSQTQDNVSIPVFVSIPSYASIELDTERLDYVLDLSSPPQNAEKILK